jgi:[ribosomal protein S5]-alanine N-acetyltransferase
MKRMIKLCLKTENLMLISTSIEYLKVLVKNGKSNYSEWMGDTEVNKYNSHGLFPQSKKEMTDFFDRCENDKSLLSFMIMTKEDNRHIGMCSLQRIDMINRSAEFAIIIGEKDYWGKGYATECLKELFNHGFNRLGLNRIWSGTSELNIGMIKCFEKLGMKKEGEYRQGQFLDGKLRNIIAYAILKNEWEGKN